MKKLLLLLTLATAAIAATPPGQIGVAVNPSGALSFLRVNAGGALLLATLGPGSSPVPAGQVGVALDPDGNLAFLNVDSSGGLIVSGGAVAGPITTSGLTMNTARMLGRTTAGVGAIEEMTAATVKTFLSLSNVTNNAQAIAGDAASSLITTATATIIGRTTAGTGALEELSASATKTLLSLNNVENTALSTWAGSTNITTLGTIATGVWSGTAIVDGKIASALTGKTYNGLTVTSSTGTLTIAALKTLTASNTLTLTATDGSTLAIGTGGTLGTAAYTASSAYVPAYSGLTTNGILQATGATTVASTLTPAGLTSVGWGTDSVITRPGTTQLDYSFASTVRFTIKTAGTTSTFLQYGGGNTAYTLTTTVGDNGVAQLATSLAALNLNSGGTQLNLGYGTGAQLTVSGANTFTITTNGSLAATFGSAQTLVTTSSIQTGTPTGGVAAAWKHGAARTGVALTVSTTTGVQLDVGGTLYTLATLTTNP